MSRSARRRSSTTPSRRRSSRSPCSGALPTLGGAAPTLVVSVRAADLQSGRGFAHIDGCDEPVSLTFARQIACSAAASQRVITDRAWPHRARSRHPIACSTTTSDSRSRLRDGGCIIPGCHVRASWCEIHHVREHARGGRDRHRQRRDPLCWHHHRTLEYSGWQIRMNQRRSRGARPDLVGQLGAMARGHELTYPNARPRR